MYINISWANRFSGRANCVDFPVNFIHAINFPFQIADLEPHMVMVGSGILVTCIVLRTVLTSTCAVRSNLNMKEKIFVGLAWMAKATVQVKLFKICCISLCLFVCSGYSSSKTTWRVFIYDDVALWKSSIYWFVFNIVRSLSQNKYENGSLSVDAFNLIRNAMCVINNEIRSI